MPVKSGFDSLLKEFAGSLSPHVSETDGQWKIKGFIDACRNVYAISSDTKIVSKVLEIHLLPKILAFAEEHKFAIVLPKHQNYYPDLSFVSKQDNAVKFAVDIKTTYRVPGKPGMCNGFTLGSHGRYFNDRTSGKNIQFPYGEYLGHFCIGIIYDRVSETATDQKAVRPIGDLRSIRSVISNIELFAVEKWKIAGDKSGSGNTANIGSIRRIADIFSENGMFSRLGEKWFDEYWINHGKISVTTQSGGVKRITSLEEFVKYRKGDVSLIVCHKNLQ